MPLLELDHIAVSCIALSDAARQLSRQLGCALDIEGQHPDMGTHNRLTGLGPYYFELIAINPKASPPDRARWFNLDNFTGPPRLTNWILRTDDLQAALKALPNGFGEPINLQRGGLKWRMAIPQNGILPWGGWAPALIEWQEGRHPTQVLPDSGLRLSALRLAHPQAEMIKNTLAPYLDTELITYDDAQTAQLTATLTGAESPIELT